MNIALPPSQWRDLIGTGAVAAKAHSINLQLKCDTMAPKCTYLPPKKRKKTKNRGEMDAVLCVHADDKLKDRFIEVTK